MLAPERSQNLDHFDQATRWGFRLQNVFHLGSQLWAQVPAPGVVDLLGNLLEEEKHPFMDHFWFQQLKSMVQAGDLNPRVAASLHREVLEVTSEWGVGMGFLLEVCTPVRTGREGSVHDLNWNTTLSHWVYGETFEEAFELALQWVATFQKGGEHGQVCG